MNLRELFLQHVAQTSVAPMALEIVRAEGCRLTDAAGKEYIDLIGGISVANTGHRHPRVVQAIRHQLDHYLHIMVYGEFVQAPQVQYAHLLTRHLPSPLRSVYFTNSGAEAVEGAMKLAKKYTGRTDMVAFQNSYHGSTQGALSMIGSEHWRNAYRPLLPGVYHGNYNDLNDLGLITKNTALVLAETVQAEAGVRAPSAAWMQALRQRCSDMGALLILDEIQTGFGRTGKLWGFEHFNIVPDMILLGKALGGGLPLGAFITSREIMMHLTNNPVLGHITTFGGHPLSCAAGQAAFEVLMDEDLINSVAGKQQLFLDKLTHPAIKKIHSVGLWLALEMQSFEECKDLVDLCVANGCITDWFLFAPNCLRISPPLTITPSEIKSACAKILNCLDQLNCT